MMGLWHPDTIDGPIAHQIDACDRCEADRRPRMFVCDYHEGWLAAAEDVIPPPGNWRVSVAEDGTVERVRIWRGSVLTGAWYDDDEQEDDRD